MAADPIPSAQPPAEPPTALAAAADQLRRRAWRTAGVVMGVCVGIALMLALLDGGRFGIRLVYSSCIGLACAAINDLVWLAQAALHDRRRAWRGLPPAPAAFLQGKASVALAALACVLAGPLLGQAVADAIFGWRSPSLLDLGSAGTRVTLTLTLMATVLMVVVVSASEREAAARARAEAAQRLAAENQLRLLQSQLEPHMLFNTLANLRVLISLDPARAQAMLDRLIAFLRATLAASRRPLHPLADEFARLDDYLALMAVRMGPRLQVALELPPALGALSVPPLLLQPLVENSIQHGLEPQVAGGRIAVRATLEEHTTGPRLLLEVQDDGQGLQAQSPGAPTSVGASLPPADPGRGFGLDGVRQRLATLYGEQATLQLLPAPGGGTLARVRLPATPAAAAVTGLPQPRP
jgi:signal transduction histidine kinase